MQLETKVKRFKFTYPQGIDRETIRNWTWEG